jgi:haloalkane dehalogenase
MELLRTPDERFDNLPGYSFAPHYITVEDVRLHYLDEGRPDVEIVLLLHGEPTWSYLYRKMIPLITSAGYRVIAPDLVGFGRSDKPAQREDYTYQKHVDWMTGFLLGLDLRNVTLVCQDWGGLIGLRLAAEQEPRFSRIIAANTALPTGDEPPNPAFQAWLHYSQTTPTLDAGSTVGVGCVVRPSPEILAAYNAPFPDERYTMGARQFPLLVPISPDDPASGPNRSAWEVLTRWEKPFLTAFSDSDPITHGGEKILQQRIPGAKGQPHTTITGAGHFLQEDKGEEFARIIVNFLQRS